MKKFLVVISITILLTSCGSIEKYNTTVTKLHPVEDLHEDVDAVYKKLKRLQPRLYQFTPKETLDYKFDSLKTAIDKPMSSRDFFRELAKVTKYIGQGHMSLSPPSLRYNKKERRARRRLEFDVSNLNFEYLDNKLIVRKASGSDAFLKHAEVLEVNSQNSLELLKKYKKTVASDGFNTTLKDRLVGYHFLHYYYLDNGRYDSISLKFRNVDSTFIKKYKRIATPKKILTAKDSIKLDSLRNTKPKKLTKEEKKARKAKIKKILKENKKYAFNPVTLERARNLKFVGKDSTVALMQLRGFEGGKYKWFHEEAFAILDSLKTKNLIIDLRNNFGGSLAEIANLYSYLTDKNFTFINKGEVNSRIPAMKSVMTNTSSISDKVIFGILSPIILPLTLLKTEKRDGKLYYKFKSSKEQEPNPLNFKGNVYVLINGNSFSASSVLSTQLKGAKRATFVGEETGGAYNGTVAGFYKNYELPNTKVEVRIGMAYVDSKYKIEPDGFGVKPDVEIIPTYQDRLNNIDPEIEWVLKDIEGK